MIIFEPRRLPVGRWVIGAALSLALACHAPPRDASAPQSAVGTAGRRAGECAAGRSVDSAYVVRVAAEALAGADGAGRLRPLSYEAVTAPGPVEEGVLVRFTVPGQVGGGGLAFVELESGCATALKHYE